MKKDNDVTLFWKKAPDWSKSLFLVSSVIYGDDRKTFNFTDQSRIQALSEIYQLNVSKNVKENALTTLSKAKKERILCIYFHKNKDVLVNSIINKLPREVAQKKNLSYSFPLKQREKM